MGLKLLVEQPNYEIETLVVEEGRDKERSMYISGPYLMAEKKNRNGRIYPLEDMEKEVNRYTSDMIKTCRSLGELNHPTSVEINPERACHMITQLVPEGNTFIGKSKILNTPMGNLVKTLITDGVKLGISSRALGKLNPSGDHNDVSDFRLICCDVVHDPSVESAFVDGILEAKEWVLKCDGTICEFVERQHNELREKVATLPRHNKEEYLKEQIINFINSIK